MANSDLATKAKRAGWERFSQVKQFVPASHKLFRSSAPSYRHLQKGADHDATQNLTPNAVKFLVEQQIDSIISFNKYSYSPEEVKRLENASPPIAYLHLPVDDWCAPTLEQLRQANEFFVGKSSTLLHCGYGHGRTGTGVTGLQICATNGQTLNPFASTWWGRRGNHVEKRRQMSVLAELRNNLLQNRSTAFPDGGLKMEFAIINFATGYYLTLSRNGQKVVAMSPEKLDPFLHTKRQYRWFIKRDGTTNNFKLSNCANTLTFMNTKSSNANTDDPVTNRTGEGANTLFTTTEADGRPRVYFITPVNPESAKYAIAIKEPDNSCKRLDMSGETPVLLATKDDKNKFGLWILLPVVSSASSRR
ncbi:hypothetical protein EV363DRAFT_1397433 [Boletus edulis]|nr:hypothetical protein EV363DRAFT_1408022 [Boletus edulis]KAF8133187.1 hypothetical protein EV363DRAFT_1397433 [Boletus edulis]